MGFMRELSLFCTAGSGPGLGEIERGVTLHRGRAGGCGQTVGVFGQGERRADVIGTGEQLGLHVESVNLGCEVVLAAEPQAAKHTLAGPW